MKKIFIVFIYGIFIFTYIHVDAVKSTDKFEGLSYPNSHASDEFTIVRNVSTADATFLVSLSSGISPEGAKVVLEHLQLPDTTYTATVPDSGVVVVQGIYPGFYQVNISRFAYETNSFKAMIDGGQLFEVVLMQETLPVSELGIDDVSLLMTWLSPQKKGVLFEEDFSSGSFETQGWTAEPPNWVLNDTIGNDQPSACFMGIPNSSNYSFSLTSKIIELAGSQALHLNYDIFLSNIDISIVEMMAVEIWCGQEWNTVNAHDADGIEIMPWTTETIDISDFSADDLQFRFRAYGNETNSVEYWSIDNIAITASEPDFPVLEYNVYLDDTLTGIATDTCFFIPANLVQYGQQYTAGIEAVYESGISERVEVSFTSWYLPPPENLQGGCVGNDAVLSWDMPGSAFASRLEALVGYYIYRDESKIDSVPPEVLTYIDEDLMAGQYDYTVTALYDLSLLGFTGIGESLPVPGIEIFINDFGLELPFEEGWDLASISLGNWERGGDVPLYWKINIAMGNPLPAVEFSGDPAVTDYMAWLMSPPLNATPYTCADIYVEFDIKLDDNHADEKEELLVQVYKYGYWQTLKKFDNAGSFDWETHKLRIYTGAGETFYIRFVASGENSAGINRWLIDNIHAFGECRPPDYLDAYCPDWPVYQNFYIIWDEPDCSSSPSGEMLKLSQWDGSASNAYFQEFNHAYGVVFDLSAYPDATIEMLDFHHSSWGVSYNWDYKLHIVDWNSYELITTIGPLSTTGDDKWENEIDLGSVPGFGEQLVGIMLEPLGHLPTDAYPCLSADNELNGLSLTGEVPNWSAFSASGVGDFLMNLWIRTMFGGESEVMKLKPLGLPSGNSHTKASPGKISTNELLQHSQIINDNGITSHCSDELKYHVYRSEDFGLTFYRLTDEPVDGFSYHDYIENSAFMPYYYITAVYDTLCESIPSDIVAPTILLSVIETAEDGILISPVPADQMLSVSLTNDIRKLQIINIYGQMVYEQMIGDGGQIHIDTSAFPTGAYFVRGFDGAGNSFSKKILITR
jgi:hypothetical protein